MTTNNDITATVEAANLSFNQEFAELVWGEADSTLHRLRQMGRDHRQTGAIYADEGNAVLAASFKASALAYEHAASMIDLAFEQALARVARQVQA